jgi:hypothetical protein
MPNLELAQKTHDLLYYLENPRIYDSGKESLEIPHLKYPKVWQVIWPRFFRNPNNDSLKVSSVLAFDNHPQHIVSNVHPHLTSALPPTLPSFFT